MQTLTPRGFLFPAPAFDALSGRQVLSSSETNSIPAPSRIGSQQHSGSTHRHDLRVLPQLPQKPESTARLSIPPVAQTLPLPIQRNRCFALLRNHQDIGSTRLFMISAHASSQAYQANLNSRADDARKVAEDQPQLLDMMMSFRISQVLQPPLPSSPVQAAQKVFA